MNLSEYIRHLKVTLSRKQKYSKNWYEAKYKLNKIQAKINNKRNNLIHTLSKELAVKIDKSYDKTNIKKSIVKACFLYLIYDLKLICDFKRLK